MAPSRIDSIAVSLVPEAVMKTMGTAGFSRRISSKVDKPLSSGRTMSRTTTSGCNVAASLHGLSPRGGRMHGDVRVLKAPLKDANNAPVIVND